MLKLLLISLHSWAGVRRHTSGAVFPVHRDMPSSAGATGAPLFVRSGAGSSDLSSSTSCGSSGACVALQRAGSPRSSRRGSFLWDDSTRCSRLSGSTIGRWCVGPSATRWDALSLTVRPLHTFRAAVAKWLEESSSNGIVGGRDTNNESTYD